MSEFKKLSRDEMKKIGGGDIHPLCTLYCEQDLGRPNVVQTPVPDCTEYTQAMSCTNGAAVVISCTCTNI